MLSRNTINRIKKYVGISDWALFKKNIHKKIGKLIYHKKYTADDIVDCMAKMGMQPGDVIFIHSSMKEFYNYQGTGEELIRKIIAYLGPEGTLVMPAYPKSTFSTLSKKCLLEDYKGIDDAIMFDAKTTPTEAGYLAEVFRKMEGVKRSINIQHSACAIGKYADFLLSEHHLCRTCWDEKSPYYKLTLVNAKVFAFGLPYFLTTTIHCTDSLLRTKYDYFAQFFNREIKYNYRDSEGNIGTHQMLVNSIERKRDKRRMVKLYFDKKEFHVSRLSNLRIERVDAKYTHELFMKLANQGIVMYSVPDPRKSDWTPRS